MIQVLDRLGIRAVLGDQRKSLEWEREARERGWHTAFLDEDRVPLPALHAPTAGISQRPGRSHAGCSGSVGQGNLHPAAGSGVASGGWDS